MLHDATSAQPSVQPVDIDGEALASEIRLRHLFDAHLDFVWRSLRRLGVPELTADDAAQEVFLVASRRLADIEVGREKSFLFATALRVASTSRRAQTRRGEQDEAAIQHLVDPSPGPDELADRTRARVLLDIILARMELALRAVFVLYELEEMTMAEIAVTLEIPPGTVASRLRRARDEFQAAVTRVRGPA
ncbi:MAG: sigma-70 family RNA polymerase sigma factor [Kofleriaceae bacterium]